jgi:hypothetical protein
MKNIKQSGDVSKLSGLQREVLHEKVLPQAERWLSIPSLRKHAEQTLAYWGVIDGEGAK